MEQSPSSELKQATGELWSIPLGIAAPFAVKAAIKLDLFNIISKSHGATLHEILSELQRLNPSDCPQSDRLFRLLRFLVFKKVLAFDKVESRYGLTPVSKLLVSDENKLYLAPILHFWTSEVFMGSWEHMDEVVKNPGEANGFLKAHGMNPMDYIVHHPEFARTAEEFRVSFNVIAIQSAMQSYKGFESIRKLVDVGGGSGFFSAELVKLYPHIEAYNLDLAQAFANTPEFPGVKNIVGNALESIPSADGIFMKHFVHMFDDPKALKILRNCYQALEPNGRVIICDMVLDVEKELHLECDMVFLSGAQRFERSKEEWSSLLASAGLKNIGFLEISPLFSIIEAFKQT